MHQLRRENQKMRLSSSWALHLRTYFMNAKKIVRGFSLHSGAKQMCHIMALQGNGDECKKNSLWEKEGTQTFFFVAALDFPLFLSRADIP